MSVKLPDKFLQNMKELLGGEFSAFLSSYEKSEHRGLRTNRLKIEAADFLNISPFELQMIPYIDNGFIYDTENPAKDPYYHAGLYYLQEPSAMLPANRLRVYNGDRVLDLCAAPGGKATELLGKLNGSGLLYANDISASRAQALLKNLELTGAGNYYVTAEKPENLAERLPEFFDKILCDVPCSGEGMFRKDHSLIASYMNSDISGFVHMQRDILDSAYKMLKPGGFLMYSTCTFNLSENEENITWFLDKYSDMALADIEGYEGFSCGFMGFDKCVRVFPHKMQGEGHFLALMRKNADKDSADGMSSAIKGFEAECTSETLRIGDSVFKLPALSDNGYRKGLRYLRTGLYVGDTFVSKKGDTQLQYSQSYAMTLDKNFENCLDLLHSDVRVNKYLKGETIFAEHNEHIDSGYTLILVDGFPLGFAKSDGTKLKNMLNPSWRMM